MKKYNLFFTMILVMGLATTALISCNGDDDDDDTPSGGCEQEELAKLALLTSGTWVLDSVDQDGLVPQFPIEESTTFTFKADEENCEAHTVTVGDGNYIFGTAADAKFEFVANTEFGRIAITGVSETIIVKELTDAKFAFTVEVKEEKASSRVQYIGEYYFEFVKQ